MSEMVPEGWGIRQAEEIYERLKVPRVYDRNDVSSNGSFPILDQSEDGEIGFIDSKPEFDCSIRNPIITFANHTCAVRKLSSPFGVIQNVFPLKNRKDTDINYIFQILKGGVEPEGYKGHYPKLRETEFLVPPLPEQKKIASILTSVDEVIEKTQSQIDKLQDLKKGTMNELLTKGIGHTEFKDSELGRIPKSWEVRNGEELLDSQKRYPMRSGPFGSALLKSELVPEGIPFLGIDNVHKEFFKTEYHRFISAQKFNELDRYQVFPDDVMVTIMGTVGRCCIVPKNTPKAISSKHTWVMTFDKKKILPELVCWQINNSNWVLKHFADNSQGGVMDAISSETLRNTKFPVPPILEQHKISQAYQNIRNSINLLVSRLDKTQSLKKSLMQDLLTGKVRVSVN